MNIIDQVILIPTSPDTIWSIVSDISQNKQWQVNVENLSFLNTIQEAEGMRWRYVHDGRTHIAETSAWYNRLGYEYIIVDGAPYAQARGRIRLQEIPEGTLVQWTFQYESSGVLGGLRNIGIKRALTKEIEEGLRNLYKYVMEQAKDAEHHEAKSLMRDAPTYEERSQYQSRYSAEAQPVQPGQAAPPQPEMTPEPAASLEPALITEPPVEEDDTRPNPVIQAMDNEPMPEPDFVANMPPVPVVEPPPVYEPKIVAPPEPEPQVDVKPTPVSEPPPAPEQPAPFAKVTAETASASQEKIPPFAEAPKPKPEPVPDAPASAQPEKISPAQTPVPLSDASQPAVDVGDTSKISVFEVFGMQKPSETQEMRPVSAEDVAEKTISQKLQTVQSESVSVDAPAETAPDTSQPEAASPKSDMVPGVVYNLRRTGFRMAQRQRQIPIRRPEE